MYKMNPEVKKKWIDALLSGEYKQGKKHLKSGDNEFCCLGVLCDISKLAEWEDGDCTRVETYLRVSDTLPQEVMEWAELLSNNPTFDIRDVFPLLRTDKEWVNKTTSLAELNDEGASFEEIAKVIEKLL